MNYGKAFKCKKCPQSNGEKGCPMWWEFMALDIASGKEELKKMCGYAALPTFLTAVIEASNRPAAAIESTRNEIAKGLKKVALAVNTMPVPKIMNNPEDEDHGPS